MCSKLRSRTGKTFSLHYTTATTKEEGNVIFFGICYTLRKSERTCLPKGIFDGVALPVGVGKLCGGSFLVMRDKDGEKFNKYKSIFFQILQHVEITSFSWHNIIELAYNCKRLHVSKKLFLPGELQFSSTFQVVVFVLMVSSFHSVFQYRMKISFYSW